MVQQHQTRASVVYTVAFAVVAVFSFIVGVAYSDIVQQWRPMTTELLRSHRRVPPTTEMQTRRQGRRTGLIEWLHIPKTGTSFGNTLVLWACPELDKARVWVTAEGFNPAVPERCRQKCVVHHASMWAKRVGLACTCVCRLEGREHLFYTALNGHLLRAQRCPPPPPPPPPIPVQHHHTLNPLSTTFPVSLEPATPPPSAPPATLPTTRFRRDASLQPRFFDRWPTGMHASLENRTDEELGQVFTLLRSPRARLASGFHFVRR
jgi:hypothetical protein